MSPFPKKPRFDRTVYLDHAAATPLDKGVLKAMESHNKQFANPSALYADSVNEKRTIEDVREQLASALTAQPDTIYFTGSGTESANMAMFGIARAHEGHGKHIIVSAIEHPAVLEPAKQLERERFEVTYLSVDEQGSVSVDEFKEALREDTILVSIMYANNEIGTIQPIADIGRELLKWRKETGNRYPYFHSDACQATNYLELAVEKLHVDLMTINASKIYGPKGVGALYVRRNVEIEPIIVGGGQEDGFRSGTENVVGIVGFGTAIEKAMQLRELEATRAQGLTQYFWDTLLKEIDGVSLNGPEIGDNRLPNNVNVTFEGVEAEALVLYLDQYGIMCATGSACASAKDRMSHVLEACGKSSDQIAGSVRFTIGRDTTKKDIEYVVKYLKEIVSEFRNII